LQFKILADASIQKAHGGTGVLSWINAASPRVPSYTICAVGMEARAVPPAHTGVCGWFL